MEAETEEEPNQQHIKARAAAVYLEYDVDDPPPHPGPDWTRFVCISDTHGAVFPVPPGDVLLHTGDITNVGGIQDFQRTIDWLCALPHGIKLIIAGNHDLPLHRGWYDDNYERFSYFGAEKEDVELILCAFKGDQAKEGRLVYLEDEMYTFRVKPDGKEWKVWGSPWQPWFHNWAFNYKPGEAEGIVSKIPPVDILMTHGPPYGILDLNVMRKLTGCPTLHEHLSRIQPRLHAFGHIHEAHGAKVHRLPVPGENSMYEAIMVNAANQPLGRKAHSENGRLVPTGGPGFRLVIVDLWDLWR